MVAKPTLPYILILLLQYCTDEEEFVRLVRGSRRERFTEGNIPACSGSGTVSDSLDRLPGMTRPHDGVVEVSWPTIVMRGVTRSDR